VRDNEQAFADALKMGQVDPLGATLSLARRLKALRKHLAAQLAHRLAQIDREAAVGTTLMTRKGA